MCDTNFIKNLTLIPSNNCKSLCVSLFRSDGELFKIPLTMLTDGEANKVRDFISLLESFRTCECRMGVSCSKHKR